jgi:hypothetical protein
VPFAAGYARRVHPVRPVRCLARTLIRTAGAPACLILVAATGCSAQTQVEGAVAGLPVGTTPQQITIDLHGHAEAVNRSSDAGTRRIVVSPDGRWNAVLTLPGQAGNTGEVALERRLSGRSRRIVERHLFTGPASVRWSPDSRWLAMTVWRPGLTSAVAVSVSGGRHVLAAPSCSGDGAQDGLAWAPRGDRIALAVPAPGTGCARGQELLVRSLQSGRGHVIARAISGVPVWSADGRWIATSGSSSELMHSDGTSRHALGGGAAVWGPQGNRIAIVSNGTLLMGTPTKLHRVAAELEAGPLPAFSPDGRLLAYLQGAIVVRRTANRTVQLRVPVENAQITRLTWTARARVRLIVDAYTQGD